MGKRTNSKMKRVIIRDLPYLLIGKELEETVERRELIKEKDELKEKVKKLEAKMEELEAQNKANVAEIADLKD
jgi:hypothetical protein